MKILAIETSCDETAAAVVEDGVRIVSEVVASSAKLHQQYGGIMPEVAARQQVVSIIPVVNETLKKAAIELPPDPSGLGGLDAIAVTIGPGLIGSLLVGVETAKVLSFVWQKPLVPLNHIVGHIYSAWLSNQLAAPKLPALAITVSGGHTELVLIQKHGQLQLLGSTRDDAAGETFDKIGRALGLPYPGGPQIEKLSRGGNPERYTLPRPMLGQDNLDFSFSGLKTATLRLLSKLGVNDYRTEIDKLSKKQIGDIAASLQQAIIDVLVGKTIQAARRHPVNSIFLTGGVSANQALRRQLAGAVQESFGNQTRFFCPPTHLATDNATYIATAAYFNFENWKLDPKNPKELTKIFSLGPNPNLEIEAKTPW